MQKVPEECFNIIFPYSCNNIGICSPAEGPAYGDTGRLLYKGNALKKGQRLPSGGAEVAFHGQVLLAVSTRWCHSSAEASISFWREPACLKLAKNSFPKKGVQVLRCTFWSTTCLICVTIYKTFFPFTVFFSPLNYLN